MSRLIRRGTIRFAEILRIPNEDLRATCFSISAIDCALIPPTSASVAPDANKLGCSEFQARPRTLPRCRSVVNRQVLVSKAMRTVSKSHSTRRSGICILLWVFAAFKYLCGIIKRYFAVVHSSSENAFGPAIARRIPCEAIKSAAIRVVVLAIVRAMHRMTWRCDSHLEYYRYVVSSTHLAWTGTRPLHLSASSSSANTSHSSKLAWLLNDSSNAPLTVPVANNGPPRDDRDQANVAVRCMVCAIATGQPVSCVGQISPTFGWSWASALHRCKQVRSTLRRRQSRSAYTLRLCTGLRVYQNTGVELLTLKR